MRPALLIRVTLVSAAIAIAIPCVLAQSPLERAVTLAREKRYQDAQAALKDVPEPTPPGQRVAFHRLKAAVAAGLGDATTATSEMRAALKLAPADTTLLLATAVAEIQSGQLDGALEHARAAGNSATAKALIGDIEERRGAFQAAVSSYREAIVLAPGNEGYRVTLALDLIRHQTFEPAIALLKESSVLFPKSARVRTLLGIALYASGEAEDAIGSLLDAIELEPNSDSARRCLAQIVLESSAVPRPKVIEQLCVWNATVCSALRLRVARVSGDAAMRDSAIAGLQRGTDLTAHCELARAYEWTDRLEEARSQMEVCLKGDQSPQNHYRMGLIYRRLGLAELARKEMDLRNSMLKNMSEETAAGLESLKSFR